MKPEEIYEKIEKGSPLTREESAWLDAQLESSEQMQMASLIRELPEKPPSFSWRDSLSARLLSEVSKRRGFWAKLGLTPVAGSSLAAVTAAAILMAVVFRVPTTSEQKLGADTLLQWHEEAIASTALPGDGTELDGFSVTTPQRKIDDTDDLLYGGSLHAL